MIRATLQTKRCDFVAYGNTTDSATRYLRALLAEHARQYDLEPNWAERAGYISEIKVEYCAAGVAYRDGERVKLP
jgi:hypothetical protein